MGKRKTMKRRSIVCAGLSKESTEVGRVDRRAYGRRHGRRTAEMAAQTGLKRRKKPPSLFWKQARRRKGGKEKQKGNHISHKRGRGTESLQDQKGCSRARMLKYGTKKFLWGTAKLELKGARNQRGVWQIGGGNNKTLSCLGKKSGRRTAYGGRPI